jgi:hypothetical protein
LGAAFGKAERNRPDAYAIFDDLIRRNMDSLKKYRKNIYSQNGEDGVIEEILSRLKIAKGFFVEFGAWDGKNLSNTYNLLEQGWKGVHIEGDKQKFEELVKTASTFPDQLEIINAFVQPDGDNNLDSLLSTTHCPEDVDLMSIDIDSNEWHIWQSLNNYHPKIVIIEINSSIPVGIYQTHRDGICQGSSFSSTVELGKEKGYTPVCHTGNLILVRDELIGKLGLPARDLKYPELLLDYQWIRLTYDTSVLSQIRKEVRKKIKMLFKAHHP